ncbi:MAG: alpha/beta fold hydrolase [Cyanobacteriota bacterium]|nr:alpha/beta fold hydrolase [Cyanobacteriota bacterium]
MATIANIPYVLVHFDQKGKPLDPLVLPEGITDLFVVSHGWNNTQADAESLYTELFTNVAAVAPASLLNRKLAILGIIWPAKKFTELVQATAKSGGAASIGSRDNADGTLRAKLDLLQELFGPDSAATIQAAKDQILTMEDDPAARDSFVSLLLGLVDRSAAHRDDATDKLFKLTGSQLLEKLKVDTPLPPPSASAGGAASLRSEAETPQELGGGAAGLGDVFTGIKAGATRFLNFLTYYEMKARAGTVGTGVGLLLDEQLPASVERIHLVGHSFGGRLVSAAALASCTDKIKSMTLLQAAFSHNGFSDNFDNSSTPHPGYFRPVIDQKRVDGPILITYTPNDIAVGILYPAASRLSGTVASAYGDKNDKFGGIGRNGAQKMKPGEVKEDVNKLLPVNGSYAWQTGKIHNLEASDFIRDPKGIDAHGFVKGKEIAWAIGSAASSV